mgnify:CR=1 FL=1
MDKEEKGGMEGGRKRKERVLGGKKIGQATQCFEHSAVL